jgi:choline dehydrogenase-like flavoprotein
MTGGMGTYDTDVLVLGSGSAGLVAALTAAAQGLSVTVLEKTDRLGGTTAMSGAGTWVPANHHAAAAGIEDSVEEALTYVRAAAPEGWAATEEPLWRAFINAAPEMLRFVEAKTPLRFALTPEPDPLRTLPGAKLKGRMVSVRALSRWRAGRFAFRIRKSTIPEIFTYHEAVTTDIYHKPYRTALSPGAEAGLALAGQCPGEGHGAGHRTAARLPRCRRAIRTVRARGRTDAGCRRLRHRRRGRAPGRAGGLDRAPRRGDRDRRLRMGCRDAEAAFPGSGRLPRQPDGA